MAGRTLGSYLAELVKYGGICLVAIAIGGFLVGAAQAAFEADSAWSGLLTRLAAKLLLPIALVGGACWAIGHMMLAPRRSRPPNG